MDRFDLSAFSELFSAHLESLRELSSTLQRQKDAFIGPYDPEVGERRGAEALEPELFGIRAIDTELAS